ncbi:hypothetical protein BVRB_9g221700 [Beta vulgaris subsp. vulgaris]|nr:hypothetical protein BVRB_9g221700 [Beta vulgaris subsp. vulgaris]
MDTLPIELIFIIFAHLPIKCLLRLKTVCKSWLTIISSSNFINFHLHLNSLSSSNQLLIFYTNNHQSLYSVFLNSLKSPAMKLCFFNEDLSFSGISGSCNGLILCNLNHNKTQNFDVCLVNPSTLKFRKIPKLQVPKNYLYVNFGLGYDFKRDDYKIVRIVNFVYACEDGSIFNAREVMVYSMRSNSWKFIEEKVSNHATLASRNGALVNNHLLHWMFWCTSMNEHRLSSFDVCNEKWGEISMPDCFKENGINRGNQVNWLVCDGDDKKLDVVDLGILGGCLCLLTTNNFVIHSSDVDIWVMKNYGVKESWVKLFHVEDFDVTRSLKVAPIAYCEDGKEILLRRDEDSNVFWYDLREKRVRNVDYCGLPDYHGVSTCIQSLVPIDGNGT